MRTALALLFAFFVAGAANGSSWVLTSADLEIELRPEQKVARITGRSTLRLDGAEPSAGPTLGVNSREPLVHIVSMKVVMPERPHAPVEPVRLEGKPAEIAPIRFDEPLPAGAEVTVEFALETSGRGSQFVVDPGFALASWVEAWYPRPGTIEEGFGSPTAPGTTTIRMPEGWRSVAAGTLTASRIEEGKRVETWTATTPMARSFAAGPLTRVEVEAERIPVSFFVLSPSPAYRHRAALLGRAIEAMEARFGPYPYPSWNVVEIPEDLITFAAASEQGFIMVRSSVLADESGALPLFAHEAGHAWWGNRMRTDGDGGRVVGEALAQYGAVVAIESLEGRDAATTFLRFSRKGYNPVQCALGYFYIARIGQDEPLATADGKSAHNLADSKGMWFHHMLRHRVGDERFFATLRGFFQKFDGREATLDDFRGAFLAAGDDPGMERFLAQWLDRTGAPEIDLTWWSVERGAAIEVTLVQRGEGEPYALDLDLEIELLDGATVTERARLTERTHTFKIATPQRAVGVRMDPEHLVLMWRPEYGPPLSRPAE